MPCCQNNGGISLCIAKYFQIPGCECLPTRASPCGRVSYRKLLLSCHGPPSRRISVCVRETDTPDSGVACARALWWEPAQHTRTEGRMGSAFGGPGQDSMKWQERRNRARHGTGRRVQRCRRSSCILGTWLLAGRTACRWRGLCPPTASEQNILEFGSKWVSGSQMRAVGL